MTALDDFTPHGEPIHPYDLFELIDGVTAPTIERVQDSPTPVDEADYERNRHKSGSVIKLNGKTYFETTTVEAKTKRFA